MNVQTGEQRDLLRALAFLVQITALVLLATSPALVVLLYRAAF